MPTNEEVREAVREAVSSALAEHNTFWLLAALSERGFEEGDRNRNFGESVSSFSAAGVPSQLCDSLRRGINGMLSELLRRLLPDHSISVQPSGGRDILLRPTGTGGGAAIDVKHVYDMTSGKYYAEVAEDRRKLLQHQQSYPEDDIYQVVFFVQLPHFDYPAGIWYGHKRCKARGEYLVAKTLSSQYDRVVRNIGRDATWPGTCPLIQKLTWPQAGIREGVVSGWFQQVFEPFDGLAEFSPAQHLKDAAVGTAIWEY